MQQSLLKFMSDEDFRDYLKDGNFQNKDIALQKYDYTLLPPFSFTTNQTETLSSLTIYSTEGCLIETISNTLVKTSGNTFYIPYHVYNPLDTGKYFYYKLTTTTNVYYSELFEIENYGLGTFSATAIQDSYNFDILDNNNLPIYQNI